MATTTFQQAVDETAELKGAFCAGLQALEKKDAAKVAKKLANTWRGSVNIDKALLDKPLKAPYANANRWDYGIGIRRGNSDEVVWAEFHPAASLHVDEVLRKLRWLRDWLESPAKPVGKLPRRYVWVATGKVTVTRDSRRMKLLAQEGLVFAGSRLDIDKL